MKNHKKEKMRMKFRLIRDRISPSQQRILSRKILKNFLQIPELKKTETVGVYVSKGSEVRTFPIIQKLLKFKKKIAAPKTHKKNSDLTFHKIKSLKDCILGNFNILEPQSKCPKVSLSEINLILVPGIVFDRQGHRLGYGKGFYDTFLKKSAVFSIGLTYEKNLISKLPSAKKDIPVSCIVTEKKVYRIK